MTQNRRNKFIFSGPPNVVVIVIVIVIVVVVVVIVVVVAVVVVVVVDMTKWLKTVYLDIFIALTVLEI